MAETKHTIELVKQKILEAENILVALSRDPSVDEMAAAIGLTMLLDNAGKHATAIYSGKTPNALEFLKPAETFESNTNSLQDFIIALNKDKADHLRYKVEGDYVRVYITPYKTTISESDLEFSHGDFNVDLIIALNVKTTESLDAALSEYGRIMHDATAINITTGDVGDFGEIKWNDQSQSSISEMLVTLAAATEELKIDRDIATAFLAGIIAATDRFSNDHTTPDTMTIAADLMKLGADQKLISDNIELSGERDAAPEAKPAPEVSIPGLDATAIPATPATPEPEPEPEPVTSATPPAPTINPEPSIELKPEPTLGDLADAQSKVAPEVAIKPESTPAEAPKPGEFSIDHGEEKTVSAEDQSGEELDLSNPNPEDKPNLTPTHTGLVQHAQNSEVPQGPEPTPGAQPGLNPTLEQQSATAQLEQMIQPPAEDPMLEQLRQVANDVKPPEFKPGQNPAEVIAPKLTEKEANDIPDMNFGGGINIAPPEGKPSGLNITPPSELPDNTPGLNPAPNPSLTSEPMASMPAPESPEPLPDLPDMPEGMLVGDKPLDAATLASANDDIKLPTPPPPPVGDTPDLPSSNPDTPSIQNDAAGEFKIPGM